MLYEIKYRRTALVISAIAVSVFALVRCAGKSQKEKQPGEEKTSAFAQYAGDEKCSSCHKDIFEQHLQTAHHLTSQPAEARYIRGSFDKGSNSFSYTPDLKVQMEKRDSGYYQVIYFKGEEKMAIRFDIVIGSGVMGQSYLNWRRDHLFQMPVTYFSAAEQWSNSPGFPEDKVLTDRPVTSRCFECHVTFAEGSGGTPMEPAGFEKSKILYGIGCEKCHGPSAKHVTWHQEHPEDKKGQYTLNPSSFTRQQQLDLCALCHGGKIQKIKPSFEFTAGDKLEDYFSLNIIVDAAMASGEVEVHGNQYGLLQASKCFKSSTMTCFTCHDSHENERSKMELYSSRCVTCHDLKKAGFNTPAHSRITSIEKNCIDCHMPAQPSKAIAVKLQGEATPRASLIRSHYIGIYNKKENQ